jgi:3',5'-cyclic AMP phosphodiesterase CpdA
MIRLAHLSDVHITARPLGWRRADWFSKRLTGWLNLALLGRARRFRLAEQVLGVLMTELRQRRPDRVVFSGDATALGFEAEFARAAALLGLSAGEPLPGLAVPGNHDYFTPFCVSSGLFERHFAPWQSGERIDSHTYPFAQRIGDGWLVAVNSSKPNFWPWDASGAVSQDQLERLEALLARLVGGPRILVTHYPVCRACGRNERRTHGLRGLHRLLDVARRGGVSLWLHGHRHGPYHHPQHPYAPFPVICAGSATQHGLWSYNEYTLTGRRLEVVRRVFDLAAGQFCDRTTFELELPHHEPARILT